MLGINYTLKSIFGSAILLGMMQTQPIGNELPWIGQVERTGLLGALLIAVWILARKLDALMDSKDKLIADQVQQRTADATRKDALLLEKDQLRVAELAKKDAQLEEKDRQQLDMVAKMMATLTQQVETNRELREIIRESVQTKAALKVSIDTLGENIAKLPCCLSSGEHDRGERRR